MTTTVVKKIGSAGGRDYSDPGSWLAACPANLVTADQVWWGDMYNDSEFTSSGGFLGISGITTDATRYIRLGCASGQGIAGNGSKLTNKLQYNQANGVALRCTGSAQAWLIVTVNDYVLIDGLQLSNVGATNYTNGGCVALTAGSNSLINGCIGYTAESNYSLPNFRITDGVAINCLAITNGDGDGFDANGTYHTSSIRSCTAAGVGSGPSIAFGTEQYNLTSVYNDAAMGFGTAFHANSAFQGGSSFNASTTGGTIGSGPTSLTLSSQYFDTTSSTTNMDWRVKSGSGLIGQGTPDGLVAFGVAWGIQDILGQARDATHPTIGCHEYVAAPTGSVAAATGSALAKAIAGFIAQATGSLFASIFTPNNVKVAGAGSGTSTAAMLSIYPGTPGSDITVASWTSSLGGALYLAVDENPPDDTNYIFSPNNPTTQTCEIKFLAIPDPGTNTGHVVRYRLKATGLTTTFTFTLVQGTTTIKTWTQSVTVGGFAAYSQSLTSTEAGTITDYTDLRLRIQASV